MLFFMHFYHSVGLFIIMHRHAVSLTSFFSFNTNFLIWNCVISVVYFRISFTLIKTRHRNKRACYAVLSSFLYITDIVVSACYQGNTKCVSPSYL